MSDNRAVFLDRDGCVNVEDNHIRAIEQFRLYPDTLESISKLNHAGFLIVIITNQSGVARGLMTEEFVKKVHQLMLEWFDEAGVKVDAVEYCPHHPDGVVEKYAIKCDCRKPAPGMLNRAAKKLDIDFSRSYVVGDKLSDIELGPVTGAKAIMVRTGFGEREAEKISDGDHPAPNYIAYGIKDAVEWILSDARLPGQS